MLKVGDLVLMNNHGFVYYGNPEHTFENFKVGSSVNHKDFIWSMCERYAILGVGTVLRVDKKMSAVEVTFKNSVKGIYYYNTMFYEVDALTKLTLFQKLKYKILGRI